MMPTRDAATPPKPDLKEEPFGQGGWGQWVGVVASRCDRSVRLSRARELGQDESTGPNARRYSDVRVVGGGRFARNSW